MLVLFFSQEGIYHNSPRADSTMNACDVQVNPSEPEPLPNYTPRPPPAQILFNLRLDSDKPHQLLTGYHSSLHLQLEYCRPLPLLGRYFGSLFLRVGTKLGHCVSGHKVLNQTASGHRKLKFPLRVYFSAPQLFP
ncbi:hypothetical protein L873DRAFT_1445000 [Choiromyces venosus 120613-1]|uniref:Uncharacterized protein n=1 Tax=Choiromyces venosus 120613-1 TaxID=1336337 RepID=A0A3N4IVU9_9PEZI|nr:hypothetical protein L873DRAFT_1445000 [Choiromyces venosus 120613-1]